MNTTKDIAINFIERIWNKQLFEELDHYLHTEFHDHSLPPSLPTTCEGTRQWILLTSKSFEHETVIEEQVTEGDKTILRIRMHLKHIGPWRDIEATGISLSTTGYRYFLIKDQKIIEHRALIDGNAIENQLKETFRGCKVPE